MAFRNFKCNFLPCSANNYSQLIDPVHLDWARHRKSHLFRKPISIPIRFTSLILSFLPALFFKTENSWGNKAKSICQLQKPQRRPCSELLKYLTTSDDPPHTKPTENRNSSRDKCASKKKSHTQPQSQQAQGMPEQQQPATSSQQGRWVPLGSLSKWTLCFLPSVSVWDKRGGGVGWNLPWTQLERKVFGR